MHEWALADGVIATAIKVAKEKDLEKVTEIKIKMGQLQQVENETLDFAFKELIRQNEFFLDGVKIVYEKENAVFKCRVCGRKWEMSNALLMLEEDDRESIHFIPEMAHMHLKCPECGSPDFEILKGRGVWIDSIKGKLK